MVRDKNLYVKLLKLKQRYDWPLDNLRYYIPFTNKRYSYDKKPTKRFINGWQRRSVTSLKKIKYIEKYLKYIIWLPWIQMVIITGSVASLNAKEGDDIDLWFIVSPRRIWLTRIFDWVIFNILGIRRNRNSRVVKNKLCINYYKSTDYLLLGQQNFSFAMQFVDSIPIFIKDFSLWFSLIDANSHWLMKYFPDWTEYMISINTEKYTYVNENRLLKSTLDIIEYFLGVVQRAKSGNYNFSVSNIYKNEICFWKD